MCQAAPSDAQLRRLPAGDPGCAPIVRRSASRILAGGLPRLAQSLQCGCTSISQACQSAPSSPKAKTSSLSSGLSAASSQVSPTAARGFGLVGIVTSKPIPWLALRHRHRTLLTASESLTRSWISSRGKIAPRMMQHLLYSKCIARTRRAAYHLARALFDRCTALLPTQASSPTSVDESRHGTCKSACAVVTIGIYGVIVTGGQRVSFHDHALACWKD